MKIALIGASNNSEKYGNKILKDLINKGYTVYPVNHKETEIEGIKTFKSINDIKENFDIVNFVVPANITLEILQKYKKLLQNKKVWIQPGAENDEVKNFLKNNGFTDFITDSCIMVEKIN